MTTIINFSYNYARRILSSAKTFVYPQLSKETQAHCVQTIEQSGKTLPAKEQPQFFHNPLWGGLGQEDLLFLEKNYPNILPKLLSLKDKDGNNLFKNVSEVFQFLKEISTVVDFQYGTAITQELYQQKGWSPIGAEAITRLAFQRISFVQKILARIDQIPQNTLQELALRYDRKTLESLILSQENLHPVISYPQTELLSEYEALFLSILGGFEWDDHSTLPKALWIQSSQDWNQSFYPLLNKDLLHDLKTHYNCRFRLVETAKQLNHEIALVAEQVHLLIIAAHGSPKILQFQDFVTTETPLPALQGFA